jgi:secondary thiamine-phosphate synthase enzyme
MGNFKVATTRLNFSTQAAISFLDLSEQVQQAVTQSGIQNGIAHVFAPHSTGVLMLTENDPALLGDLKQFLETLVPRRGNYAHPDNAHAHLRSVLLPPDRTLPVVNGQVELGTWQSLMFVETDTRHRQRTVFVQVLGET